jgi:RimJ/RimL family protein N-acetyltransferase
LRIETERLVLVPLRPEDADEMFEVLGDSRLHGYIGGSPLGLAELRARYERLVAGDPERKNEWHNWIVRDKASGRAVGTMQATVPCTAARTSAEVAWVVGVAHQRRGIASEAARALVDFLVSDGVCTIEANIHPGHTASEAVARRAGLEPTSVEKNGETVWRRSVNNRK